MTIRKTLLVAFLGLGLGIAMVLTALAFVKARDALRSEIDRNMKIEAEGVAEQIDKMMFERLQNAAIWSRLDVMQDLQIRDVDKRLSRFLADLHTGYRDVYDDLSCVDTHNRVVGSSDASLVGRTLVDPPPWLHASISDSSLDLRLEQSDGDVDVLIGVPIVSTFTGERIGALRLTLDWTEIDDVLDHAASGSGRVLAVLDRDGRLIAASERLRRRDLLVTPALATWRSLAGKVAERPGQPVFDADVIVSAAASHGYAQFAGFGWTTLIVQPVDEALGPVHRMAAIFFLLLGVIALLTILIALWVSRAIARPIAALTEFAREYMRSKVLQAPASAGTGEVRELTDAFVQMVRDIDLSQQNLVRASKLAAVGEMSSVIAHEVRTPLGIMRSSAQMLSREPAISDEGRELAGFIESETDRLNGLVSTMLDSARPRQPSFAEVDMHELLRRAVAMLGAQAAKKHVEVALLLRATRPMAECDEEQMTQVTLNLLMNGLQVVAPEGRLEVGTGDESETLVIDIADDGPGIAPAERVHVFDAFFSKREGGVGLGLAVVQQIVLAHGGTIEAMESRFGGAQFRIRIPRRRAGSA